MVSRLPGPGALPQPQSAWAAWLEALAPGGWPPSAGTEAIKGELLRWAKPRARDQEKETPAPGEVAPGHQVRAEQQEVGKWCRGTWQVGSRDQTANEEQIHELCLFTLSYPRLKRAPVF